MTLPETIQQGYTIQSSHPSLPGHFPGDPIVPGVVILEYVSELLYSWQPDVQISSVAQAKFHHPLRPEQEFTLTLTKKNTNIIKFECAIHTKILASGQLNIKSSPS